MEFFSCSISKHERYMLKRIMSAIPRWAQPHSFKDVQSFLILTNFIAGSSVSMLKSYAQYRISSEGRYLSGH